MVEWFRANETKGSGSYSRQTPTAKVKEQAYNPSLSVLNLSKKYGEERLEAACAHALPRLGSPRYRHLKAILDSNLDDPAAPMREKPGGGQEPGPRGHVRGADYYRE